MAKLYWKVTVALKKPTETRDIFVFATDARAAGLIAKQKALSKFNVKMHEVSVSYVEEEDWDPMFDEQLEDAKEEETDNDDE